MIKLIIGFDGYSLNPEQVELFTKIKPFGFILFTRNMQSKEQVTELTKQLRQITHQDIIIWTDQEGGLVSRLESCAIVPKGTFKDSAHFYQMYKEQGLDATKAAVREQYHNMGSILQELGINGNFAPVADLLHPDAHEIIGRRSFGPTPETVVSLCNAAILGLRDAGVKTCIKHIPGHGRAKLDSHHDLPIIDADIPELERTDFRIFKELANKSDFAMTAHVTYTCLDDKNPVTLSENAITYIRNNIGYTNPLITDDICMDALSGNLAQRAQESLKAGCDIVLCCHPSITQIEEIYERFATGETAASAA